MTGIRGWAARNAKWPLAPYTYDAGLLGPEEVPKTLGCFRRGI
jgi:hypothetical protein